MTVLRSLNILAGMSTEARAKNGELLLYPDNIASIENFYGQSIISARQFDLPALETFYGQALEIDGMIKKNRAALAERLKHQIVATLFYQSSTRTRLMFEVAAKRLGAKVVTETDVQFSSRSRGESLEHTIRVVSGMVDGVVLRDPKPGFAEDVLPYAVSPIFNGGDGAREHPFQALKDYYTLRKEFGDLRGRRVTLLGDLKYGRTVHSLAYILNLHGSEVMLVAPNPLRAPREMVEMLQRGCPVVKEFTSFAEMEEAGEDPGDVTYVTRLQIEKVETDPDINPDNKLSMITLLRREYTNYTITPDWVVKYPGNRLMHPLPIGGGEIDPSLDFHQQSIYFSQSDNGVPTAAAVLQLCLVG